MQFKFNIPNIYIWLVTASVGLILLGIAQFVFAETHRLEALTVLCFGVIFWLIATFTEVSDE